MTKSKRFLVFGSLSYDLKIIEAENLAKKQITARDWSILATGSALEIAKSLTNLQFESAICGHISCDILAEQILGELDRNNISTRYLKKNPFTKTQLNIDVTSDDKNHSDQLIIEVDVPSTNSPASFDLDTIDEKIDYLYIGDDFGSLEYLNEILLFAKTNKIKVVLQLQKTNYDFSKLKLLLSDVDFLIATDDVIKLLAGTSSLMEAYRKLSSPELELLINALNQWIYIKNKIVLTIAWQGQAVKFINFGVGFVAGMLKINDSNKALLHGLAFSYSGGLGDLDEVKLKISKGSI